MSWMTVRKCMLCLILILFLICPITCDGVDVTFVWDYPNPSDDLMEFNLYQSEDPNMLIYDLDNTSHVATISASERSVTISDVICNRVWYWALTANDMLENSSDISNIVCYDFINMQTCGIVPYSGTGNFLRIK